MNNYIIIQPYIQKNKSKFARDITDARRRLYGKSNTDVTYHCKLAHGVMRMLGLLHH